MRHAGAFFIDGAWVVPAGTRRLAVLDPATDAPFAERDTVYGLAAYMQSGDITRTREVVSRFQAGVVHLNTAAPDFAASLGGYQQSGGGRGCGEQGLKEFLETKAIVGYL